MRRLNSDPPAKKKGGPKNHTNVETAIVAGKVRKWKGQLLDVYLPNLRKQLEASRDFLFKTAGIPQNLFSSQ